MNSCFTDMEIEELAEGMIRQYLGNLENAPLKVDIEGFLTRYLKLPLKFRSFAEEDSGKIGFISDGITLSKGDGSIGKGPAAPGRGGPETVHPGP